MLFSSLTFLYYFIPVFFIVYFALPDKFKNVALLIASLFFYAWGEPKYVILMVIEVSIIYVLGLQIEKHKEEKLGKILMILSVVICLGILGYYKYADFMIDSFNKATGLSIKFLGVVLPIGISFYTFQILSYTVDVYRGHAKAQRSLLNLATYIAMFPQLIAGPIVRYTDVEPKLSVRTHSIDKVALGIRRFAVGLGKKVILANALGEIVRAYHASTEITVLYAWIYAVAASLQIYFDFSGYSDMAIGLGHMLGFDFPENFNYPFQAKSITDFWRRWHMTLGSWFRDYVYIPLGGNRVSTLRGIFNVFVVWALTGLWHGAAWTYAMWGLYFAVFLSIEKFVLKNVLKKIGNFSYIYMFIVLAFSFVIFDASSMGAAFDTIKTLIGLGGNPASNAMSVYCLRNYGVLLIMAIIGATRGPKLLWEKIKASKAGDTIAPVLEIVFVVVILVITTASLVNGSFNPFLYFRF